MEQQWPKVRLIPECHADTALVRFLSGGFPNIDHESGIGSVVKNFTDVKDHSYQLVGIVDNDKRKPPYLDDFQEIKSASGVSLRKKPDVEHYVILLKPAIERFLLNKAQSVGISLADFNLPMELKPLIKKTKKPQIQQNTDYLNLLAELKSRQASGVVALDSMLEMFLNP